MPELRRFQRRFLSGALAPGVDTAAYSVPRGNGKSWLASYILTRFLTPGDPLHEAGKEAVLLSGSIEQARIVFKFCRDALESTGAFRFIDSATRVGIVHKATNTRLRVHGSNSRTAFGLVNVPLCVWDEPGAAEVIGGQGLWDAVATAQGKPNSPLRVVLIGTLAPATAGWWHDLVTSGSNGSTYVQALQGDPEKWDRWPEIRRCNPLTAVSASFRAKLLDERDKARADTRLKARFMSFRLNVPTADEAEMLLTVDDWQRVTGRPVAPRKGRPIVGVDLGGGRAWSAAVALWPSGRIEALALAPGIPSIREQEKRDRVPAGTYARLAIAGVLQTDGDRRVPRVETLVERVLKWRPVGLVCDRFRMSELLDATAGRVRIEPRITRWSEASEDIRVLRRYAADGPLSCERTGRALLAASLSAAMVRNDDQGSVRLVKRGSNNTARDDAASALVLAAGALSRAPAPRRTRLHLVNAS